MAGQQGQPKYGFGWPDGRLGGLGPAGSTSPDNVTIVVKYFSINFNAQHLSNSNTIRSLSSSSGYVSACYYVPYIICQGNCHDSCMSTLYN